MHATLDGATCHSRLDGSREADGEFHGYLDTEYADYAYEKVLVYSRCRTRKLLTWRIVAMNSESLVQW